jgi:hypothetical protein
MQHIGPWNDVRPLAEADADGSYEESLFEERCEEIWVARVIELIRNRSIDRSRTDEQMCRYAARWDALEAVLGYSLLEFFFSV